MLLALALAAAAPATTAIDAERAFAADAQKLGQWTAFRKYAAPDALMFTPQPVKAHDFLKDRKDPPAAVYWWPGKSFVSCDGKTAINTGPWVRDGGRAVGYFTTVWQRQPGSGWKWVYDGGDSLPFPRAQGGDIKPVIASCDRPAAPMLGQHVPFSGTKVGDGVSEDRTLRWSWRVTPDGGRHFRAYVWSGRAMELVIADDVAASPK